MSNLVNKSLPLLACLSLASAQAASVQSLMNIGDWRAASQQAAAEGDLLTAASALQLLQECPSAAQPKGLNWDYKLSTLGIEYLKKALSQKLSTTDAVDAYLLLAGHIGHQAVTTSAMAETLRAAKDSKDGFEKAVELNPNDTLAMATLAAYYGRSYSRGGMVIGVRKSDAQTTVSKAARLFNTTPDSTSAQQLRKGWAALRIAYAFEGMNDGKRVPYFNAAIKLGEQAGSAEGRCLANVARVHLKQPITQY